MHAATIFLFRNFKENIRAIRKFYSIGLDYKLILTDDRLTLCDFLAVWFEFLFSIIINIYLKLIVNNILLYNSSFLHSNNIDCLLFRL